MTLHRYRVLTGRLLLILLRVQLILLVLITSPLSLLLSLHIEGRVEQRY
jgi:hypothetical protein